MDKYIRLTERSGNGIAIKETSTNDNKSIWNAIERLAELEDKIDNGTLVELPKKCYQVVYGFGWEILEYVIVKIKYYHIGGIASVEAIRPHTMEYFTKDNRYKGRVLGVDVFFTKTEAETKLRELKGEVEK